MKNREGVPISKKNKREIEAENKKSEISSKLSAVSYEVALMPKTQEQFAKFSEQDWEKFFLNFQIFIQGLLLIDTSYSDYLKKEAEKVLGLLRDKNKNEFTQYINLMNSIEAFCLENGISAMPEDEEVRRGERYTSKAKLL